VDEIRQTLRSYILSEFLVGESPSQLKDNTPLRTSGIIDSLGTLNLVSFVEQSFGIEVEAHEASVENFDTVADLAVFVSQKQSGSSR
jgi:acyl carrier protein